MDLIEKLSLSWKNVDYPFLIHSNGKLKFSDITAKNSIDLIEIKSGDVVALIGDFEPTSIQTLLKLIDMKTIIVPLTKETKNQHSYFFESAFVDVVIEDNRVTRRQHNNTHTLINKLRRQKHAGLVLFSTGTTGRPKAILHDLTVFLKRFETPRPALRTINFLLFDHIGGINTLLHTLFNKGIIVAPKSRTVDSILKICKKYYVELLPTTPTFLRMMLMSGLVPSKIPSSLKIITYGTELMDQSTLDALCELLPAVEFRQTFGTSELGIVRVKSEAKNSLYMKIEGEGLKTRVIDGTLHIYSETRMLGYLNADSPFDNEGWYDTDDIVEEKNGFYKIIGRNTEVINVGGLKFMASEVELVALAYPKIALVKATSHKNPITGQHVELTVQPVKDSNLDIGEFKKYLKNKLPAHMVPKRVSFNSVRVGHRFKRD